MEEWCVCPVRESFEKEDTVFGIICPGPTSLLIHSTDVGYCQAHERRNTCSSTVLCPVKHCCLFLEDVDLSFAAHSQIYKWTMCTDLNTSLVVNGYDEEKELHSLLHHRPTLSISSRLV
ncbi:hypothetical protein AVEN_93662-1 [Araneus ventricosus]|uniref:Uncharacterized protein n=1 Tax=Araneus ventricosus TaxID=182803 RepID=A0A4Y2J923_ARAVE|nr:hypothetical protein AVEN_93662-1 [Araneus ventricosus]